MCSSAGGCEVRTGGMHVRLVEPELLVDPAGRLMPVVIRMFLRFNRVTEYLRLRAA